MNTNDSNIAVAPPPRTTPSAGMKPVATDTTPGMKDQLSQVASDIKGSTEEAIHAAKDSGAGFLREQQSKLAEKIKEYGCAVSAASERMDDNGNKLLVKPAEVATRELERAADYLGRADLGTILQDLGNLARKKPELVFGGLFLTGLMAVRFLKASAPEPVQETHYYNPSIR